MYNLSPPARMIKVAAADIFRRVKKGGHKQGGSLYSVSLKRKMIYFTPRLHKKDQDTFSHELQRCVGKL